MDMARIKLTQLSEHGALLDRYGASIRILGQRELVKPDVLEAVDRAVELTKHNNKAVLNVCFPYTSREEITSAIRSTVEEFSQPIPPQSSERRSPFKEDRIAHTIRSQHLSEHTKREQTTYLQPPSNNALHSPTSSTTSLSSLSSPHSDSNETTSSAATTFVPDTDSAAPSTPPQKQSHPHSHSHTLLSSSSPPQKLTPTYPSPNTITPSTLTAHTFTATDPPLDLLVRTSGVSRLSDFMLWQCHESTSIVFLDVLWPEFDLWTFLPVLWEWQWRVMKEAKMEMRGEKGRERAVGVRAGG